MQNYYQLLNAQPTFTLDDLRRNYKQLILQCHPDKLQQQQQYGKREDEIEEDDAFNIEAAVTDPNVDESKQKKFHVINEAWNTLKDPVKRKHYDAELLQNKFQTHNNIYETIALSDMRPEDEDSSGNEAGNEAAHIKLGKENHDEDAAAATDKGNDKDLTKTRHSRTIYYVYNCRCGGQYTLDDESANVLRRQHSPQHRHRQRHPHVKPLQSEKTSVAVDGAGAATAANIDSLLDGDVDDVDVDVDCEVEQTCDDDVDEVIVECSECSLVIIVKPSNH